MHSLLHKIGQKLAQGRPHELALGFAVLSVMLAGLLLGMDYLLLRSGSLGQTAAVILALVMVQTALVFAFLRPGIEKARQLNRNFRYLVSHDALTGCLNANFFGTLVSSELQARAGREDAIKSIESNRHVENPNSDCLGIVTLSNLGEINVQFGYEAGDKVLQMVAKHLREALGEKTLIARLAGCNFAVFMPNVSISSANRLLVMALSAIEQEVINAQKDRSMSAARMIGVQSIAMVHMADISLDEHFRECLRQLKAEQGGMAAVNETTREDIWQDRGGSITLH